ncbi:MAG: hypothetical protein IPH77_17415 [Ignavibacteria bacterium]|nr:hypothetical protein [Ignavibacteria bacterium]
MKRLFIAFFLFLSFLLSLNVASAQTQPTFNLTAKNFVYTDSIGTGGAAYDAMTFDIYIHIQMPSSGSVRVRF